MRSHKYANNVEIDPVAKTLERVLLAPDSIHSKVTII